MEIEIIAVMLASYLLGSIPFGLLLTKLVQGVDIRDYGSGNIGATNAYRVLGLGGGVTVLLLDAAKGTVSVLLAQSVLGLDNPYLYLLAGLFAIAGHNLSIFLGFEGGRGVATSVGVLGSLSPQAVLIVFVVWLALVITTQYASVGSITGAALIPIVMYFFTDTWAEPGFALLMGVFVIYSHKPNIKRLLAGEENKVELKLSPDD